MLNSVLKQLVLLIWIITEGHDKVKYRLLINGFKPNSDRLDQGSPTFSNMRASRTTCQGPRATHTFLAKFS